MKKGMAMEGFIMPDGTVKPSYKYDDTELRAKIQTNTDNIDNLDSRVTELEEHGGVEDPTKADKVEDATAGNLASLDAEGNLQDSGNNPADFAPAAHAHSSIVDTYLHTDNGISVDNGGINISVDNGESGGEVDITADNIGNLYRALATPSSIPENDADKLITSAAVYGALAKKVDFVNANIIISKDTTTSTYPINEESVQDAIQNFVDHVAANKVVICSIETALGNVVSGISYGLAWWEDNESDNELTVKVILGSSQFSTGPLQYEGRHDINFTLATWAKTDLGTF